jgi:hypothetical protein
MEDYDRILSQEKREFWRKVFVLPLRIVSLLLGNLGVVALTTSEYLNELLPQKSQDEFVKATKIKNAELKNWQNKINNIAKKRLQKKVGKR